MPAGALRKRVDERVNVLVLCTDAGWTQAVHAAAAEVGASTCHATHSPRDALARLMNRHRNYSHFLLEHGAAGPLMHDLVGLTAGDGQSGCELVMLERGDGAPAHTPVIERPTRTSLTGALSAREPASVVHQDEIGVEELREALMNGRIETRYQPIVRMSDRRAVGLEALARLHHHERGIVSPDDFVPGIEAAGLSALLTEAVAARAMADIGNAVLEQYDLFLAINMPLDVMLQHHARDRMDDQRNRSGVAANRLLVELTESRPVADVVRLAAAVDGWRSAGYRLAIDDMGPDIVNSHALMRLPFHTLKLDKGIVTESATRRASHDYLQRTVTLARSHGMAVIAEGVEDEVAWQRMANLGVDQVQGFLMARPLPANALQYWLETRGAGNSAE